MPSKKCRLPTEFGRFTKLPPSRIAEIKEAAQAAARSFKEGNESVYALLISTANQSLSKHEIGLFSAFLMSEAGA